MVAYNPVLLMKCHCHINVKHCGAVSAIKYLYKDMFKGTDRGCTEIKENDEITMHKYGRVMSSNEGHYRMACFKLHDLAPRVERLSYFIPSKKNVAFNIELSAIDNKNAIEENYEKEKMIQWSDLNEKERVAFDTFSKESSQLEEEKMEDIEQIEQKLERLQKKRRRRFKNVKTFLNRKWKNFTMI